MSDSAAKQLVHSFIFSQLDYCNSLLNGLPECQLKRIQQIQNNAARVVCCVKKYEHITPSLQALHWLPVKERIQFKILLLTYKCVNGQGPSYLKDLLNDYKPSQSLRSEDKRTFMNTKISYKKW